MYKAVIFDFDGVVADTMKDNCKAWQLALKTLGVEINPIEYFLLEGMGRFQIAKYFIRQYKLQPDFYIKLAESKEYFYNEINNFKFFPEIVEILEFLKQNKTKLGLVTGASKNRINTHLSKDFINFFDVIVTADDVKESKPNPEPYDNAVKYLKIDANEALVIENAKLGIQSAKSAGCFCIAIETTLPRNYLIQADQIFSNHNELLQKLKTLNFI